ncbi:MAG: bifunctional glutamate N-acetyltransferase/amino-acid acetyltransferase ArgJ [Gammaproteobacteria bacterium]|nr:bifunctional glutamate N-acetyltransferase/amino-acid acetyltransferase ArgJ [Gammaproteobacteria bacterium]
MAVGYAGLPKLMVVPGVRIGVACAGIKKAEKRDLVLFELAQSSTAAAVFTRNAFCAAPVIVAREHLEERSPRYLLINTGNANAGTGRAGLDDAQACCEALAKRVECDAREILPFSTGVIGEPLPVAKITAAIPELVRSLSEDNWENAAYGIMTTDTVPKGTTRQIQIDGQNITLTGISKGSGMIRPDMGTMLSFVATDARLDAGLLKECLGRAVGASFNRITVDGDTSTNDACVLVASGHSGVSIEKGTAGYQRFVEALNELLIELAQLIVRDGEGATKFISVEVNGGRDEGECSQVAYTIAHSPLVKTALFASDPNWGRILAAVGRAGLDSLDMEAVSIYLDEVCIVSNGGRDKLYSEERGQAVMQRDEITIRVELARGESHTTVWTCDFSYDYVKINAEYRT